MLLKPRGLAVLLALVCVIGLANAAPERNAFVNRNVTSKAGLINEIRTDKEVRDRYMRHFAMNEEDLIAYLSTLHQAQIEQDGTYHVFSIPPDGIVKEHTQVLKRGDVVLSSSDGTPVILLKCGNPLSRGPSQPQSENLMQPFVNDTPVSTLREFAAIPEAVPEDTMATMLAPSVADVPIVTVIPPAPPPTGGSNIPIAPSGGNNAGVLGILGLLGGAALLGGSHGGPPVVPEPMSIIALGVGVAGVLRARRRGK